MIFVDYYKVLGLNKTATLKGHQKCLPEISHESITPI